MAYLRDEHEDQGSPKRMITEILSFYLWLSSRTLATPDMNNYFRVLEESSMDEKSANGEPDGDRVKKGSWLIIIK